MMNIYRLAPYFARVTAIIVMVASLTVCPAHAQTIEALDVTFKDWMTKNGVSQGVLAVTHERRLVLTRGYGGTAPGAAVLLASLSKAITGTCIGTLVDAGKLSFDTRVGEVLADLFRRNGNPADPRVKDLTVAQLLTHRSGYDKVIDPAVGNTLSDYLMDHRVNTAAIEPLLGRAFRIPLPHAPGMAYNYSNMSYLTLGAIIEAVTGQPYEQYCRDVVLNPLGIEGAKLDPTWTILSSYGGWRLTGPQYLRFLEVFAPSSRVLGAKSQAFMAGGEDKWLNDRKDIYYALGILVRPLPSGGHNVWHAGAWRYDFRNSINGVLRENTGTYAVRLARGVSWFAQYQPKPDDAAVTELDRAMGRAIGAVMTWPTEDLYAIAGKN